MGNRKQPFGYRMEMGEIVIHPQEAEVVRFIFREYIAGAAFNGLVNALKNQEIPYDADKLWNKNMVARILGDKRYVGENGFPAIVERSDMETAQRIRERKQNPVQKTAAQKLLRQLSGHTATPNMERQVVDLLNSLILRPDKIVAIPQEPDAHACEAIQSQLDSVMLVQPIDEEKAKDLILQLASAQYDAISPTEYETERLKRLFTGAELMNELDAELLKSAISSIQISGSGTMRLRLKNHQILGDDPR